MKVWVVEYYDTDYVWVLERIFSSEEKAKDYMKGCHDPQNFACNEWEVE